MVKSAKKNWVKRETLAWMLVSQGFSILPLFFYLPLWLPFVWLFSMVWRIQIYRGAWSFPSNKIKTLIGAFCIILLLVSFSGKLAVEPLVTFLVISFVLKLLEVRSQSDVLLVIYVGFITVATQFLFSQTAPMALYGMISVVLLLSAWNCIYRSKGVSISRQLKISYLLFVQSIPLMLVLFLVIPRLGSLWHVPLPQGGTTGFSDMMSPGDLSELSKSRKVAFRVSFDVGSAFPEQKDLYWRALVLDYFDGRTWHYRPGIYASASKPSNSPPLAWQLQVPRNNEYYRYTVLMEPHQHDWLFSLMTPVSANSEQLLLHFGSDYLTKSRRPVSSRSQYRVVSAKRYVAQPNQISDTRLRNLLSFPQSFNPQTQALAAQWVNEGLSEKEIIQQALALYSKSFYYSLRAPALGRNSIDDFIFGSQKGFCEHFSSSFVFLMRAAGIPSRVVVGYQGGEYNSIENYIIVRQSDAHAWAEVWLEGEGWVRVDPTAAVSPSRIEQGLESSLDSDEKALVEPMFKAAFMAYARMQLDAFSYSWHKWVLAYDDDSQNRFFNKLLGGASALYIGLFFLATVGGILFLYFLVFTWRGIPRFDYPEEKIYFFILKQLKKLGFEPLPNESPMAFVRRVAEVRKDIAPHLLEFAQLYEKVAYKEDIRALKFLKKRYKAYTFR